MKKFIIIFVIGVIAGGMAAVAYLSPNTACVTDADCGGPYESDLYCQDNTIKNDLVSYSCVNGNTKEALCQEMRTPNIVKECRYPYACDLGACIQQDCNQLGDTVWLGGPAISRIFFDRTQHRGKLSIIAMRTGANFKVHLYMDDNDKPSRNLGDWGPLNDESINELGWVTLNMQNVETMPADYYWIGIEVLEYGDMAFNSCVRNDRDDGTHGRSDNITNGVLDNLFQDLDRRTEHDLVHIFE